VNTAPDFEPDTPAALKLDLLCKGLHVDDVAAVEAAGRPIRRTRAGMASGVDLILPGETHVNAPILERWITDSPYHLRHKDGSFFVEKRGSGLVSQNGDSDAPQRDLTKNGTRPLFPCPVTVPPQPAWYEARTRSGVPMKRVAVMQGSYLAAYVGPACQNWLDEPRRNCKFCSVGLNLGRSEDEEKRVSDLVEVACRARDETGVTFVHMNIGYQPDHGAIDLVEPYVKALRDETGLLIGVQAPPHPDLERYDALKRMGVNNISFCLEFWTEEELQRTCPGKYARSGREDFVRAIEHCAPMFNTTNGEIIAGIEPIEATLEGIDWITSVGAIPTVCIFRPLTGTDYEDRPSPTYESMKPVFAHLWEACMRHGLPVGIAPNVKVSIVMLPEECRWLHATPNAFPFKRAKLALMRTLFGAYFRRRLKRAGKNRASAAPAE